MLNPDRAEFRLQPASVSENFKKNGHIPRWARISAFALRASLAILTTTPSMVVAADLINHIGGTSTSNSEYNLDSPQVYKLYLNAGGFVIQGFRDEANFEGDFPIDKSHTIDAGAAFRNVFPVDRARIIDDGGNTHIKVKSEQTLEISASGKVNTCPFVYNCGDNPYNAYNGGNLYRWAKSCNEAPVFNPDGYHIWRDGALCPSNTQTGGFADGSLIGFLYYSRLTYPNLSNWYSPEVQIGSHWKGIMENRKKQEDLEGNLYLKINGSSSSGGYDVTVTVYPLEQKVLPTVPAAIPTASSKIETAVSSQKDTGLPAWLWGLGVLSLAGLALFLRRGISKTTAAGSVSATGTGTSSSAKVSSLPSGISGAIGGPSNPNTAPNFGPTQQKNPEWVTGQQEFERRWQAAKSKLLPIQPGETGNEPEHILDRFKAGMGIVHEVSLNSRISVPLMAVRVRAGIEYLIPQVWPENRILKRFFDPGFNAGFLTNEDLAKILYLPEQYRSLSNFTDQQRRNIRRIRRILMFALHPDTAKVDTDKNLQESVDDLLKKFNPAWSYIDNLIK